MAQGMSLAESNHLARKLFGRVGAGVTFRSRHSASVIELEDKMRYLLIVLWMLLGSVTSAIAQVSIGIHLQLFPELVRVPGYPVYYAPRLNSNFFFYDGMYWVYLHDTWYASSWYNGPWWLVEPQFVPVFILRVPVRYYRVPPGYFYGWRPDAPPRWGEHWGNEWERHRRGWGKWNRSAVPAPAPLPVYQRQYSGDRYPQVVAQQQALHNRNYRYQPRDTVVRQHYQGQGLAAQKAPAPSQREQPAAQQERPRSARQQDIQRPDQPPPLQQGRSATPRSQPPQRGGEEDQRAAPGQIHPQQRGPAVQDQRRQPPQGAAPHEQQAPRSIQENAPKGKGAPQEPRRKQGQGKDRDKDEDRGQDRK